MNKYSILAFGVFLLLVISIMACVEVEQSYLDTSSGEVVEIVGGTEIEQNNVVIEKIELSKHNFMHKIIDYDLDIVCYHVYGHDSDSVFCIKK